MITEKYLNIVMIPCFVSNGRHEHWVDPLWYQDLMGHLRYIPNFTLAAPARPDPVPPLSRVLEPDLVSYVDLPPCRSMVSAVLTLPRALVGLWKAVGRTDVVHASVAGWPISYGWFAVPMGKLRGKLVLVNIESAPWRAEFRRPWRLKARFQAHLFEGMAKICVNLADVATFTQTDYMESLLSRRRRDRGHVISASWIEADDILTREQAEALWASKLAGPPRPLRVVYAAHLNVNKGVRVLVAALQELQRRGVEVEADIFGEGALRAECEQAAADLNGPVRLTLRGMVAYGAPFFQMLQGHDVMVVPSITDEQPRVVYDCGAQALPVIASETPGIRECVHDGVNGRLVPPEDPVALADALQRAAADRDGLRPLGMAGLDVAFSLTHDQMHARRVEIVRRLLLERNAHAISPSH
jgi:glycosyltransferase involved in cell wall biosynthesis